MNPISHPDQILADLLVVAFGAPEQEQRFLQLCHKYSPQVIHRALRRARQVPADSIKKSRVALFFYLTKRYAHQPTHHFGP